LVELGEQAVVVQCRVAVRRHRLRIGRGGGQLGTGAVYEGRRLREQVALDHLRLQAGRGRVAPRAAEVGSPQLPRRHARTDVAEPHVVGGVLQSGVGDAAAHLHLFADRHRLQPDRPGVERLAGRPERRGHLFGHRGGPRGDLRQQLRPDACRRVGHGGGQRQAIVARAVDQPVHELLPRGRVPLFAPRQ